MMKVGSTRKLPTVVHLPAALVDISLARLCLRDNISAIIRAPPPFPAHVSTLMATFALL